MPRQVPILEISKLPNRGILLITTSTVFNAGETDGDRRRQHALQHGVISLHPACVVLCHVMLRSARAVVAARFAKYPKMATPMVGGPLRSEGRKSTYTTTALKRWSCQSADELPGGSLFNLSLSFPWPDSEKLIAILTAVTQIKAIHVYDFDNTRTSPQLYSSFNGGPSRLTIFFFSVFSILESPS